jgi:hypothetical protein
MDRSPRTAASSPISSCASGIRAAPRDDAQTRPPLRASLGGAAKVERDAALDGPDAGGAGERPEGHPVPFLSVRLGGGAKLAKALRASLATVKRVTGRYGTGSRPPAVAMMASMVDEKKKAEIQRHLSTLRAEVDALARTDADGAKTIAAFAELSAHQATRPKPHPELLALSVTGLEKSVKEFEATHPRLVEIVGSLSAMLSNIGL